MASPIAGSPFTRNMGWGGSTCPRLTVAISPRRNTRSPASDGQRLDIPFVIERAAHAQEHALLFGLHDAGRTHRVLCLQCCHDGRKVETQPGQSVGRKLDEYLLVLRAQHLDFGDVGNQQQPRARRFDIVAQLAERKSVGCKGVDDAESTAEVVVEKRPNDAGWQRLPHVADIRADLVPDIGNRSRRR